MRAKCDDVVAFLSWPVDGWGEVGGAKPREQRAPADAIRPGMPSAHCRAVSTVQGACEAGQMSSVSKLQARSQDAQGSRSRLTTALSGAHARSVLTEPLPGDV